MDRRAGRVRRHDTLRHAAELLALSGASDIAVVEDDGRYIGILAEGDILRALMPDVSGLEDANATLEQAYANFVDMGTRWADEPVERLSIRESYSVHPDDELLRPASLMVAEGIRGIAVVEDGYFVGTITRTDICWALLVGQRAAPESS